MPSKKSKSNDLPKQVEHSRRGAAGTAKTTAGRARTFEDRSKYSRKEGKAVSDIERERILDKVPAEFHMAIADIAYENGGETYGEDYELQLIENIVDKLVGPLKKFEEKIRDEDREYWRKFIPYPPMD